MRRHCTAHARRQPLPRTTDAGCLLLTALTGLFHAMVAAEAAAPTPVLPVPRDDGAGMLFHASFDDGNRADFAIGARLPVMADYTRYDRTPAGGQRVPGVFGNGFSSPGGRYARTGDFDARGNVLSERGTIAFHVRQQGMVYGFEPLWIKTAYHSYYWGMYLRLCNKGNALSAWFADETYRPEVLHAGDAATLTEKEWYHLAIAWDQAYGAQFYVDGNLVASNWGQASWTSRGVDADRVTLHQSKGVAYDELYIFDRPLSHEQVSQLAASNIVPSRDDLPSATFDAPRRRNRLRELSWELSDPAIPDVRVGADGLGANALRQVVPLQARTVKRDCNEVFDGKLGSGWPPLYNYGFNGGNGLHVELGEAWDFATIEGRFDGSIYRDERLVEDDGDGPPFARIRAQSFLHRWPLEEPCEGGWLSLFKGTMEDKGDLPDKELVTTSRVCELSFFRLGVHDAAEAEPLRYYIGPADVGIGPTALGAEFSGQFGPGDRAALALSRQPPGDAGGQRLAGLRYHHLIVPTVPEDTALTGLRLVLNLRGLDDGNLLRLEMRDAILPTRRVLAIDFRLRVPDGGGDEGQRVDITLDLADRLIPRGHPCWITFCLRDDTDLLWGGPDRASFLDLLVGTRETVVENVCRTELAFVKTRFRELSEARPWTSTPEPEHALAEINRYARELFYPLVLLRRLNPKHRKLQAIWAWTHKAVEDTSPVKPQPVKGCTDAPAWALLQRELRDRCRGILTWWIENRQVPNGEFGDAWGDDTDFVQNFAKLALLGDVDGQLRDAARRVADGVYRDGLIERGINARTMDTLHAYEEGVNAQPVMALIDYGNPTYLERMMEAARTVEEHLTALDAKGRRRFRSWNFGAHEVRDKGDYGYDHPGNALFCHPALFLAYYGRQPRALRFVQDWADGWIETYADHVEPGVRRFPNRTLLDGRVLGWDSKVRGYGYVDVFAALYTMTREQRYRDVSRYWTGEHGGGAFMRGSNYVPALEIFDRSRFREKLIAWADEADLLHPHADHIGGPARERYMRYEVTGDETAAYQALEVCLRNVRILYDAYTWGEPINDRIWLPDHPLIMMTQGEMSDERNQLWPRHYLSYEGFSDIAAWVRAKSGTSLKVWLYNFAAAEEQGTARTWRTPLGQYEIHFGVDGDGNCTPDPGGEKRVLELHRSAGISLTLPPRKLCALSVTLKQKSAEDFWTRPDLGISAADVIRQADGSVQVTVHNLGNRPLTNAVVCLCGSADTPIAEQVIPTLEAPLDLHPRTQTVTFAAAPQQGGTVHLDPGNTIPELNEANNSAPLP